MSISPLIWLLHEPNTYVKYFQRFMLENLETRLPSIVEHVTRKFVLMVNFFCNRMESTVIDATHTYGQRRNFKLLRQTDFEKL